MERGRISILDLRPVLFVVGVLLSALSALMVIPALVDILFHNPDWYGFVFSASATVFVGGALVFSTYTRRPKLGLRQAFLMTAACWIMAAAFGALPFAFMQTPMSYTDAFFEAMSAITTTGSTVMIGLDHAPPGILLWRALLQWTGGIGIIATALAVLPMLQVGGMQLFRMDFAERVDKAIPRAGALAARISLIYFGLTVVWTVLLAAAGMTWFEAVIHAMTTISTGGMSTSDASIGNFPDPVIHWIITFGMIAGALPFVLYVSTYITRRHIIFRDSQVQWFFGTLAFFVFGLTTGQIVFGSQEFEPAIRNAAFNATSIMTGTGFATDEYDRWGAFSPAIFFILMFIGGCAGSTSCGIKIFRFQILFAATGLELKKLIQPHGVFIAYYNRRPISQEVIGSVLAFCLIYAAGFAILTVVLSVLGLDFLTATSGAATAISNVGPGLGSIIGPAGTFAALPDAAKWALAVGMLLGRLEFFTILVLFVPSFWRA